MLIYERNVHIRNRTLSQLGAGKISLPLNLTDISNCRVASLLIRSASVLDMMEFSDSYETLQKLWRFSILCKCVIILETNICVPSWRVEGVDLTSSKVAHNLSQTYKKPYCKGDLYLTSSQRNICYRQIGIHTVPFINIKIMSSYCVLYRCILIFYNCLALLL